MDMACIYVLERNGQGRGWPRLTGDHRIPPVTGALLLEKQRKGGGWGWQARLGYQRQEGNDDGASRHGRARRGPLLGRLGHAQALARVRERRRGARS